MAEITKETTLFDLNQDIDFIQVKDKLIGGGKGLFYGEYGEMSLEKLNKKQPTWDVDDMVYGMERLKEVAKKMERYVYYPISEDKENVHLIYLPAKEKKTDRFVILCAGGGYGAVCTFVEAIPVAAKLNELGIDCFCLNYKTFRPEHMETGYLPAPLADLAAAWRLINQNRESLGVDSSNYYVGGFSAGGHLAALWGSRIGAVEYGIPDAKGLLLAYPLIAPRTIPGELGVLLHDGLAGKKNANRVESLYSVDKNIIKEYPRTYLVQCEDDDTVPISNSYLMEDALEQKGVEHLVERYTSGGHGFGLGSKLADRSWVDTAVEFLEILK